MRILFRLYIAWIELQMSFKLWKARRNIARIEKQLAKRIQEVKDGKHFSNHAGARL